MAVSASFPPTTFSFTALAAAPRKADTRAAASFVSSASTAAAEHSLAAAIESARKFACYICICACIWHAYAYVYVDMGKTQVAYVLAYALVLANDSAAQVVAEALGLSVAADPRAAP